MDLGARIPMPIEGAPSPDDARLRLAQWLSPSFPISAYAYSHGIETAIERGAVTNAAETEHWVQTVLEVGAGRNDAILLCRAIVGDPVKGLSDLAAALAGSAERWEETRAQGAAFAATLRAMGDSVPDAPLPVALGFAARQLGLSAEEVARHYLQAFAGALISAAVRHVPLGQAEGQGILARLRPVCLAIARSAAKSDTDDLGGAAFGSDLDAIRHETQQVRIFRT